MPSKEPLHGSVALGDHDERMRLCGSNEALMVMRSDKEVSGTLGSEIVGCKCVRSNVKKMKNEGYTIVKLRKKFLGFLLDKVERLFVLKFKMETA